MSPKLDERDGPETGASIPSRIDRPGTAGESRAATLWMVVGLAVAYFIAGKAGLRFASVHPSATAIWPPTGIAFAALLMLGYRVWPGIFIGAFIVNLTTAGSIATCLAIATGDTLEGLIGVWLVMRFAGGLKVFDTAQNIFKFAVLACLASTTVSASVGVTSLAVGGYARWADYGPIWLTWWVGDASGGLIVTPVLVLWRQSHLWSAIRRRPIEAALLLLSMVGIDFFVFGGVLAPGTPGMFLCIPALVWTAFRFGQWEAASAVALLTAIAGWGTARGFGPFAPAGPFESLLLLRGFTAVMSAITLPMSAVLSDRERIIAQRAAALERERAARADAESANRAKDEFLAMVGHELRNPLTPILLALGLMRTREEHPQERELTIIERQVRHLVRLVDDLLDVSRVTSGKIELKKEPVEIADAVAKAIEIAGPLLEPRKQGLSVEVPRHGLTVEADPTRLAQVISNLLTNAAKYTESGGRITLIAERERGEVVLRVRDNGIGIEPAMLNKVFDLFVQDRRTVHRSEGGLGLGLSIVKSLVAMHGGTVTAFSEGWGRGSEFVVRLPAAAAPQAGPAAPSAAERPTASDDRRAGYRVLVVDDNRDAAEMLARWLETNGHRTRIANDGAAALRAAGEFSPDIAVVDISMPIMDGYELARRFREDPELRRIRLVAVTGYGQEIDRRRSTAAGFDAHLLKPVELDAVESLIERLGKP